jgi:uncharacterized membrane protein
LGDDVKSLLLDQWYRIRSSYWFVPLLMVAGAAIAAFAALDYDRSRDGQSLAHWRWLVVAEPNAARSLLATIAGSMITVAGVTFSLTLLAVSHASAQLGPRTIVQFMRDRGNQITLGVFTATFVYCLLVLQAVNGGPDTRSGALFVPQLSVLLALVFAVQSVLVLIYFIHHVPESLMVDRVLDRISLDAVARHATLFPKRLGEPAGGSPLPEDFDRRAELLRIEGMGGYVRVIDSEALLKAMADGHWLVELLIEPGDFLSAGAPVARICREGSDPVDCSAAREALLEHVTLGPLRTQEQDPVFSLLQLCEIAGRALSPGINDPFTATRAMDHLERVLLHLMSCREPDPRRLDTAGKVRMLVKPNQFARMARAVTAALEQFAAGDALASKRLVDLCETLAARGEHPELAAWFQREAERLAQALRVPEAGDAVA